MTAHVKSAGAWQELTALYVKVSGAWTAVLEGWVKSGGAWQQFYGSSGGGGGGGTSVSLSPSPAEGFRQLNNFNSSGYVSQAIVATPTGFTSPTYAWTRVSGASSSGAFSASGTSTATLTVGATLPVFQDATETWRCTVTEGSNTAYADVVVTLRVENLQ